MKSGKSESSAPPPARLRGNAPSSVPSRQLAGYLSGAVGMAAVLGATQAEAAIVYWDPADAVLDTPGDSLNFDMLTGGLTPGGVLSPTGFTLYLSAPDYTRMFSTTSWQPGLIGTGTAKLSRLAYGTAVDATGPWNGFTSANELDFDYFNDPAYPWNTGLDGTTGYVGLRFKNGSDSHYGWARLTYDDLSTGKLTLHDFAYEGEVAMGILAGAIPEPGGALLALAGMGGLVLRRRRLEA